MSADAVVATARQMNAVGINRAASGNVSVKNGDGFLITPSAVPYEALRPAEVVHMNMAGEATSGGAPSSEWRIHRDIYAAHPDVGAIVHAHPPFATSLACHHREIPACHYMVARAGGNNIRCCRYATFGTQELSGYVVEALEGRRACLMANHGIVATGSNLKGALRLAVEVESMAEVYWRALQIGEPKLLSDQQMDEALEKFSTYGKTPDCCSSGQSAPLPGAPTTGEEAPAPREANKRPKKEGGYTCL